MPAATVQFFCKKADCGAIIEETLEVNYPNFAAERMSDGDTIEMHDVSCPECGTDYEIETVNGMGSISAELNGDDIRVELEPDDDDYEDYLANYEPANDIVGAFENSVDELLNLLSNSGTVYSFKGRPVTGGSRSARRAEIDRLSPYNLRRVSRIRQRALRQTAPRASIESF